MMARTTSCPVRGFTASGCQSRGVAAIEGAEAQAVPAASRETSKRLVFCSTALGSMYRLTAGTSCKRCMRSAYNQSCHDAHLAVQSIWNLQA